MIIIKRELRKIFHTEAVSMWTQKPKKNSVYGQDILQVGFKCTPAESYQMGEISPDDVATCLDMPGEINGIRCIYKFIGKIEALSTADRYDPLVGGISIGGLDVTAGTIGGIVWDKDTGDPYIITNYHVATNSASPEVGAPIVQPGPYDGGTYPDDLVGYLKRWGHLAAGEPNYVDAAIIAPARNFLTDNFLGVTIPSKAHKTVTVGDEVCKYGRTTEYLEGFVTITDAVVSVSGYPQGTLLFENVFIVEPAISAGGDSGSRVMLKSDNSPVGLLFAGSILVTAVIPAETISQELNIVWFNGLALAGAEVTINGVTKRTNANGTVVFKLKPGSYSYEVEAIGYNGSTGSLTVDYQNKQQNIILNEE